MSGILYLVATPIGNLGDMSERALETLSQVDVIAAEDTRNSLHLLTHFGIKTPMTSYHEYNKVDKAYTLINKLKEGQDIALITDAGTPGISDPGEVLVQMCVEEGIVVTSLPGPVACINALILSGLPTRRFCFEAFFPQDKRERAEIFEELKNETRTIIFYEAPHHLKKTLREVYEALGNRKIAVCRELTKKFETILHLTLSEAVEFYENEEPRGEYVLVMEGRSRSEMILEKQKSFEEMSLEEHMDMYVLKGVDKKEAMKLVAKDRGISKRDVYNELLKNKE